MASPGETPLHKPITGKMKAMITDWDETITTKDTIALVAEAAYITHPDFPYDWSHFQDVYYSNYKQFIEDFGPRETIEEERRYQEELKQVELSSVNEYVGLQLFKNVTHETLSEQAKKVELKPNFIDVFEKIHKKKIPVYVLSCNWTSLIMKNVFQDHGISTENITFVTNEFEHNNGILTGEVQNEPSIRTGADKVREMRSILQDLKKQGINDSVYYFGDSSTDILPMLEADYGIIIDHGSALKTLEDLKISHDEGLRGDSKIKHIKNWNEINEIV